MPVMQVVELVEAMEEKFGVSAAAAVTVAAGPATAGGDAVAAEEKTEFDVVLTEVSKDVKIKTIKAVREVTGLGLKEAKTLVEEAPKPVKEGIPKEEAEEIKGKLEGAGAKAEVK